MVVEPKSLDWSVTLERKQSVIDKLVGGVTGLLKGRKVTIFNGVGTLGVHRTVSIRGVDGDSTTITADAVVLASGSVPRLIPGFEVDGRTVVTSDEFFQIERVPRRAVVIGGGAIGCEFAVHARRPGRDG